MLQTSPSTVIGNRYELQRELARGGMGSVWVAKDRKLRRLVAIKVMVPMWADSSDATTRFEREAMAVAQLQSPHVVQIFDYGIEEGCPYIVMELLEGEDLRGRLQRQERLDLETAGKVLVQTAKALSAAHAAGIIHRDLKPGNIFLAKSRDEEIIKVLDFGVAKVDQDALGATKDKDARDEKTKAGTLLGTPQYMSPEQARGLSNIDHRADLWSLSVIIYRALVGRLPFTGKSAADVIVKICTQEPTKPTTLAPDLPAEVDRFFRRAFARDINQRFESARQMAIAFSRIAPTSFPSLSMPEPMPDIADAARNRAMADADMAWDDDEEKALGRPQAPGPAAGMPGAGSALGAPGSGALGGAPGAAEPGSDIFGTPLPGAAPQLAPMFGGVGPNGEPLSSSVSGGTLPSGLVDATPAATSRPKRRSTRVFALALGAVVVGIVAVVLVGGKLLSGGSHADGAPGATGAAAAGGTGTAQAMSAAGGQPGGAAAQDAGTADASSAAENQGAEELPPDRITPGRAGGHGSKGGKTTATATATAHAGAPPPPPPPTGGDPFSERL